MLDIEQFSGTVTSRVTTEACPRCGRYYLTHVDQDEKSLHGDVVLCCGCGYYRMGDGLWKNEGVAFLVECPKCHRCQTWIRYPLFIYREDDSDLRRLLMWTCDCCLMKSSVLDSMVDPTSPSGNWYAKVLADVRIIKK